jgi:hypothetical protein
MRFLKSRSASRSFGDSSTGRRADEDERRPRVDELVELALAQLLVADREAPAELEPRPRIVRLPLGFDDGHARRQPLHLLDARQRDLEPLALEQRHVVEDLVELLARETGAAVAQIARAPQRGHLLRDVFERLLDAVDAVGRDLVRERRGRQALVQALDGLRAVDRRNRAHEDLQTPRRALLERLVRHEDLEHGTMRVCQYSRGRRRPSGARSWRHTGGAPACSTWSSAWPT